MPRALFTDIRRYDDGKGASEALACFIDQKASDYKPERFALVLTGGSGSVLLFRSLLHMVRDWENIDIFLTDERFAYKETELSNYYSLNKELIIKAAIPGSRVFLPDTSIESAEMCARDYEDKISGYFHDTGKHTFDLVVMGIGDDGHIASIFENRPGIYFDKKIAVFQHLSPTPPQLPRISLSYEILTSSENICFFVCGANKKDILKKVNYAHNGDMPAVKILLSRPDAILFTDIGFNWPDH